MKRVMVNMDDATAGLLEAQAARDKRSLSGYVGVLIDRDLRAAGLMPGQDATRAELLALAEDIGLPAALETLRRRARTTARPAA